MTSFVHLQYPTTHAAIGRVESAAGVVKQWHQQLSSGPFQKVDGLLRKLAQARLEWATLNADMASRSLRAS